jgi:hypothetical protein
MNRKLLYILAFVIIGTGVFTSCKKDRGPRLIAHIQEEDGTSAPGAIVHAWYGDNAGQPGSILNEALMNQTTRADAAGDAVFDFKFSAVLDVDVIYYKEYPDSLNPTITLIDTMFGHQVVKIEQVRQKSKENNYNITIDVK